jgi:gliding motility-associated-like protein
MVSVHSISRPRVFTALVVLSIATSDVRATHVSGVDISYTCISGNTYQIALNLFRDCSGIAMSTTETVDLVSSCGQSLTLNLTQGPGSGYEISQLCPPDLPNSDCNGGGLPGMEAYQYTGTITLNPPCNSWVVSWGTCCRNPSVNVPTSNTDDIYAEAMLNTATAPCNNSPIFTAQPIPFVCVNQPVSYNYGVYDPDGDSLVYMLISGRRTATLPLTYGTGYTPSAPIPGITLDPNTGEVNFTPTITGNFIVVVRVAQFDANGNLIGTVMRDMQFTVINCTNIVPTPPVTFTNFSGTATPTGPTSMEMCLGHQFCIDMVFSDADTNDTLTLTSNVTLALPGSTFTQTGVNPATASICWTAVAGTSPVTTFTIFAEDDACPVTGLAQQTITILFLPRTLTVEDTLLCDPSPVTLQATGGTMFTWSVLSGDPIQVGTNFSCNPCDAPVATPANTTTYVVQSDLATTCVNSDTVTISVVPPFGFDLVIPHDATCNTDSDGWVFVAPFGNAGPPWTMEALLGGVTIASLTTIGADTLMDLGAGTYQVLLTEPQGCTHDTTVVIDEPAPMLVVASDTTICLSTSAVISAVPSGGNGGYTLSWSSGLPGDGPHTVTPAVTTTYTVFATDALGCTSPVDVAEVTVNPPLSIIASGPDSICISGATQLVGTPSGGNGGPYTMVWQEIGGGVIGTGSPVNVSPGSASTWYRVTLTDNCGTPAVADSIQLLWYPAPEPDFFADPLEQCFPASITFTNTTDPNDVGPSCLWDFGDGSTGSSCGTITHLYPNVGCYDVSLTITSPNGCVGDTTFAQYVCARPYPIADFSWVPNPPNVLDPVVHFQNDSQYDVSWQWSFGPMADPSTSDVPDPVVTFPDTDEGEYPVWLHVTNEYGCPDSMLRVVVVEGIFFVYVPNAFTPDGDGANDLFGPMGQGIKNAEYRLTVFDRWGEAIFTTTDMTEFWDGTVNGTPAMNGVYAWKLEVVDKYREINKEVLGHVTLVR